MNRAEEIVLCFALLEMALVSFAQVVMRYAFGTSITWAEELLRYQLPFVAFFGADIGFRHGAHIKAEIINKLVPSRFQFLISGFSSLIVFSFCLSFAYYGLFLVLKVAASGQTTAAMGIPKYIVYLPIPVAGFFMCLRAIVGIGEKIQRYFLPVRG